MNTKSKTKQNKTLKQLVKQWFPTLFLKKKMKETDEQKMKNSEVNQQ